jgi:hypothetical protein
MNPATIIACFIVGLYIAVIIIHCFQSYINVDIEDITSDYIVFSYGIFRNLEQKIMASEIEKIIILYGSLGYVEITIKRISTPDGHKRKPINFSQRFSIFKNVNAIFQNPLFEWFFHGRIGKWEMKIAYDLSALGDVYMREWGRFWEKPKLFSREKLKELAEN